VVASLESFRWPVLVYLGSRALVLVVALVEGLVNHRSLMLELTNWDGQWYAKLAYSGYPAHPPGASASTLGFFPLYPLVVRRLAGVLAHLGGTYDFMSLIYLSGLIISGVGGLITAVLVQRLATGWWGEAAGRRAVAIFCLFPGSVVFSMAYAEGLMLPLVAACILALQKRRWLLAGILAGLATATEPEGVVLIAVCGVAALRELHNHGWHSRAARRSLVAPALSLTGVTAVAAFLWAHTGTPFATLIAQQRSWGEGFNLASLADQVQRLVWRSGHTVARKLGPPIGGLAGATVLVVLLTLLFKRRRTLSLEALVWTIGIALISVCAERVPPNSRLLITAFPAVLVVATYVSGRRLWLLQSVNVLLLVATAWFTFMIPRVLPP
jgi:Gpi18-like mannosyltransferase